MTDQHAPGDATAHVHVVDFCDPKARRSILIAAILASALGFIDGTVVSIALPAIRESVDANLREAQWVHNAYMLTLSALLLVGGAMGDRFGLARVFRLGIALFVVASLLCAISPDPVTLIAARACQGLGAAIMVPGSLAIISRAYPREERGRAIGIWAASSAVTTALGPIIGGLALTFGGPEMWRWIFAINLPLGGLAIWLLWTAVKSDTSREHSAIDWQGATLAIVGLFTISWALTQIETGADWAFWLSAGIVVLLAFLWVERRSPDPMMPLGLFASPAFSIANLLSFFLYAALSAIMFFLPMTLIVAWGEPEITASAAFAPFSIFIGLLSARMGRLGDRYGPAPLITLGCIGVGIGYILLAVLAPQQNFWGHVIPAMSLVGLGMAAVVAPLSTLVMGAVSDAQTGTASGINNAVTRMAGLIAVAGLGGVVAIVYQNASGLGSFGVASDTPQHAEAMNAAFQTVAYIAAGLALLSAALACLLVLRPEPGHR